MKPNAPAQPTELRVHFTNHHSHTIHLNSNEQIEELMHLIHREKVEELFEGMTYLLTAPYTLPETALISPLKKILTNTEVVKHTSSREYSRLEPLPFESERGYGGAFVAFEDGSSTSYLSGNTTKMVSLIKLAYDVDEYVRLDQKWQLANYSTMLLCSRDEPESHRNVLIRGLKNSLNIIALLGVR